MKKEKTINLAARMMAEKRWQGVTAEERTKVLTRAAQTPRTAKRCFCGANSMWVAANRYFDCCRKAGIITLNLEARKELKKKNLQAEETNGESKTTDES